MSPAQRHDQTEREFQQCGVYECADCGGFALILLRMGGPGRPFFSLLAFGGFWQGSDGLGHGKIKAFDT